MNTIKRWIVSDQYGKDIFCFELYTIDEIPNCLYFDSNLTFQVRHKKLLDFIGQLISIDLSENKREILVLQFFELIKKIKFFRQFYFRNTVLDKNGKLNVPLQKLIQQITEAKLNSNNPLVPISLNCNEELFTALEDHFYLHKKSIMAASKLISKATFEAQLVNDLLRAEYVSVYHRANRFYLRIDSNGEKTYFILNRNKLQFAFEVR